MAPIPGLRNLLLAAAAAVITSAGAVVVLLQPEDSTRKITGTVDAAPGLAWSVDAAATYGQAGAEFLNPFYGTEYDSGAPGFVDAGDTLVTAIGVSNDGMHVQDPKLVGIDAGTGARRWEAPAADLGGCGAAPVDGQLVCFTSDELISYAINTGKVTRTPTDWLIFAIATDDDRVYVAEGNVEDDDVRVHAGTPTDPDAHWSRAYTMGTSWEDLPFDALEVSHGQGVFTLGADFAGFDLATGAPTWTATMDGCSRTSGTDGAVVIRIRTECSGYHITGTDLLDRTGRTIATTNSEVAHSLSIDKPTDESVPVLLGDSAYDRRTGARLWTSPDLISTPRETDEDSGDATAGTAVAILGDIALLQDSVAKTTTGLDLRTGHRLWQTETDPFDTICEWDGTNVILSDFTGLRALDPQTGTTVWEIPFLAINKDPDAITNGGKLTAHKKGRYTYTSPRTMIRLRPLNH